MSVEALKKFAYERYEEGAHWVVETFSDGDYEEVLRSFATVDEAKADLQAYWELMAEREMDCRFE